MKQRTARFHAVDSARDFTQKIAAMSAPLTVDIPTDAFAPADIAKRDATIATSVADRIIAENKT